jgi:cytochrome c biogenesis protein
MHRKVHLRHIAARLWVLLQSRTLALILLSVVTGAVVLASVIPQRAAFAPADYEVWRGVHPLLAWVSETLLINQVYSTWWFLVAVSLLLLNTLACSVSRIGQQLGRASRRWTPLDEGELTRFKNWAARHSPWGVQKVLPAAGETLRRRDFGVASHSAGYQANLFAEKGKISEWGSIVFHLSFLVILLGLIYSGVTRHVGLMIIAEGQTVTDQSQDYLKLGRRPLLGAEHGGFQVRLERFEPTYYQGRTGVDYAAELTVLEGGRPVKRQVVRVNEPLTYKGASFLLVRYGFAPRFVLTDAEGKEVFDGFVNLVVLTEGAEDFFDIPGTGLRVRVRLYPDMAVEEGQMRSRSLQPINPVAHLVVSDEARTLFEGAVPLGDAAHWGEVSLSFSELRYWSQYHVAKDPGKGIIYGGFWLGVAGIAARYLFVRKRLWASLEGGPEGTRLVLGGRAEQFDALFAEEFATLVSQIKEEIEGDSE